MSKISTFNKALILLGILLIPSLAYLLITRGKNNYTRLEIFGPREAVSTGSNDTLYHTVSSFDLIAENGERFSSAALENKIVVTEFFFATCQTICPKMSMQMKRVQDAYKDDPEIMLLSFTVNPEKDSAEALASYAKEYNAIPGKWKFLTGDKKQIYELARKSFFLTAVEGDGGPDDFIHSEKLVLVDKDKRIRGYYDGTDYESVNLLIDEIKVLKWEYKK
jgi:protein SCO1